MTDASRPAHDDIVVCQQQRGQLFVYILRGARSPDQVLVQSRETAFEQAASIARRQRVRAWLTSDGQDHIPLDQVFAPMVRASKPIAPSPLLNN
jgi:hypothetical protein